MQTGTVEFALLDITIQGDKNGIWLANHIQEKYTIPDVFLTAYSDNDTIKKAIATNPYGYLIKPFQKAELFSAIEIAMLNFNKNSNPKTDSEKDFIYIKHNEVFEKVYLNEIDFIESQKNYLLITTSNNTYRHRATITDFITRLPDNFMKTHKGFIVNSSKIQNFNSSFVTVAGQKIPISKTHKDDVLQKLNHLISKD